METYKRHDISDEVDNAFLHLKRRRGIAARYAETTKAFLDSVDTR
jgi:hypothetical protein